MAEPWWVSLRRYITLIGIVVILQLLLAASLARAQSNLEVTIAGDRALTPSASSRDDTVSTSVVRRDRLAAPGVEAADVLRDLPGVQVRQSGGLAAPSTLGLRGANPNQTAAVIAGARLDDELTGVTDLSLFPLWFTNRIEIFRGASPFGFDRALPGGVLVLEPRSDTQSQGLIRADAGSFGERAAHVIASSGDESFSVTAGLRAAASNNDYPFSNNQGLLLQGNDPEVDRRRNADFSSRDVWLTASRVTPRYSFELVANRFEREQGVPKIALLSSTQSRAQTERDLWAMRAIIPVAQHWELEALFNVLGSSISLHDPFRELALLAERVDVDTLRSESGLALQRPRSASTPFDTGNDLLVIDTRTPSILGSLALPWHNGLPPRPAGLSQVGASIAVVLQRLSDDFSTHGDAEIVRIDPTSLSIVQELSLSGVSNCGRLVPRPGTTGFGLSCTGPVDRYGKSEDLSHSAVVLFDVDSSGNLTEQARISASAITAEPLQAGFTFASESVALVITQTPLGGSTNNRLLAIELATQAVTPLAEAQPGTDGTGRGLAFGAVLCTPSCSPVCLLADAAQGLLRRFDLSQQPPTELSPINVTPGVGLLPRQLATFGAP